MAEDLERNSPAKVIADPAPPEKVPAGGAGEVDCYISLWQPWASLWVGGAKLIETRGWRTMFRGRLAVHAGKKLDGDVCYREPFRRALSGLGFDQPLDLPRGAVIGWVTITDCMPMAWRHREDAKPGEFAIGALDSVIADERLTPTEAAFGNYALGRYAWITNRHRLVLPTPIPMRGLQRIQKLPPDIARLLST